MPRKRRKTFGAIVADKIYHLQSRLQDNLTRVQQLIATHQKLYGTNILATDGKTSLAEAARLRRANPPKAGKSAMGGQAPSIHADFSVSQDSPDLRRAVARGAEDSM